MMRDAGLALCLAGCLASCGPDFEVLAAAYAKDHCAALVACTEVVIDATALWGIHRRGSAVTGSWIGHCYAEHESDRRYFVCTKPAPSAFVTCTMLDHRPLGVPRPVRPVVE